MTIALLTHNFIGLTAIVHGLNFHRLSAETTEDVMVACSRLWKIGRKFFICSIQVVLTWFYEYEYAREYPQIKFDYPQNIYEDPAHRILSCRDSRAGPCRGGAHTLHGSVRWSPI